MEVASKSVIEMQKMESSLDLGKLQLQMEIEDGMVTAGMMGYVVMHWLWLWQS
uniref:HDC18578 n=1 Tax=Drosophila melanogaster TaxID=7227 RepID=Q6IIE2_DROME|nr:TPA_inf: HDC18578 [Drosophila melanogaster]